MTANPTNNAINIADKIVLVTGGKGFLGRWIMELLAVKYNAKPVCYHSFEYDLTCPQETDDLFRHIKPDYVIHAAGFNGGIEFNRKYPADIFSANSLMAINIHKCAVRYEVDKVLSIVTSCAHPDMGLEVLPEDGLWDGPCNPSVSCHGYAKRNLQFCADTFHRQYGLNAVCVCLTNLFGPCFDAETEVLTTNGIKNIKDVAIGDKVYSLNPDTHEVEIVDVVAIQRNKTKQWYNFKNKSVDFKVTPDHTIYGKINSSDKFTKHRADWFKNRVGQDFGQVTLAHHQALNTENTNSYLLVNLNHYIDDKHIVSANNKVKDFVKRSRWTPTIYNAYDWYEFLGWYISEGSYCKENVEKNMYGQLRISQCIETNPKNVKRIHNLLKRMRLEYGYDGKAFYFTSRLFKNYIEENIGIGCANKKIPHEVFNIDFPIEIRQILFECLMLGDGNKNKQKYTTKSYQLAKDFSHLCFLLGEKTTFGIDETNCYRIYFSNKKQNKTVKYKTIEIENLEEESNTYCITVSKNNIIYAGRNGKFNWIGQCDTFDFERTKVVGAIIRRVVEAKENKADRIVNWGTGAPLREFMYVIDAADAVIQALCLYEDHEQPLNIGSGKEVSIKELVEAVVRIVKYKGDVLWDAEKGDGQMKKLLDTSHMNELLDVKQTEFFSALKSTVEWYKDNKERANIQ